MPLLKKISFRLNRLSRDFGARLVLLTLLLIETLIFLVDIDTNAMISFSPFFSVPTALSAWFLGRRSMLLFVALSSVARVYDFNLMRARHDSPAMIAMDLLQSAAFYGLLAVLVYKLRGVVERMGQRARVAQRAVRRERHRRSMDNSIRRAVPADVNAIIGLTAAGGESGGFDQVVTDSVRQATLTASFTQGIVDGAALRDVWNGGQSAVPSDFWVSEINGRVAGYMMILGLNAQKGAERELHALAVDDAYRGLGVGTTLVDFFCSHYKQRRLYAACRPESTMMHMLTRRGFTLYATSSGGYQIVAKD